MKSQSPGNTFTGFLKYCYGNHACPHPRASQPTSIHQSPVIGGYTFKAQSIKLQHNSSPLSLFDASPSSWYSLHQVSRASVTLKMMSQRVGTWQLCSDSGQTKPLPSGFLLPLSHHWSQTHPTAMLAQDSGYPRAKFDCPRKKKGSIIQKNSCWPVSTLEI